MVRNRRSNYDRTGILFHEFPQENRSPAVRKNQRTGIRRQDPHVFDPGFSDGHIANPRIFESMPDHASSWHPAGDSSDSFDEHSDCGWRRSGFGRVGDSGVLLNRFRVRGVPLPSTFVPVVAVAVAVTGIVCLGSVRYFFTTMR